MEHIREVFEWVALGIEILAVAIIVWFMATGTVRWLLEPRDTFAAGYTRYRVVLGKSLLIALELLVAADIIRTVALEATLLNFSTLGLLVLVRTFLGWSLTLETEGRWPWQAERKERHDQHAIPS